MLSPPRHLPERSQTGKMTNIRVKTVLTYKDFIGLISTFGTANRWLC